MKRGNLLADLALPIEAERVEVLAEGDRCRVERIVSVAHCSPEGFWYDQSDDEWVAIISGEAKLAFDDPAEDITLGPGDWIMIPAHRRHRVAWTSTKEPTVWLAVFTRDKRSSEAR